MPRRSDDRPSAPRAGDLRLQAYLARAGVASRRASEELIAQGRVEVNGATVTAPGTKVRPGHDKVAVDGDPVEQVGITWLALHKPRGYVTARNDPYGRKTIYELIPEKYHSLFHVGRLDRDSEGILLLTNDGETANRMLHPSFGTSKEYMVDVEGQPPSEVVAHLLRGVELDDGVAKAEEVQRLHQTGDNLHRLRIVLKEGKKREIRRMMDALGHPVHRLVRRRFGPVELGELPAGKFRIVAPSELRSLDPDARRKPRKTTTADALEAPAAKKLRAGGDAPPRRSLEKPPRSADWRVRPKREDAVEAPKHAPRASAEPTGRAAGSRTGPAWKGARPGGSGKGAFQAPRTVAGGGFGKLPPKGAEKDAERPARKSRDEVEDSPSRAAPAPRASVPRAKGKYSPADRTRRDESTDRPTRPVRSEGGERPPRRSDSARPTRPSTTPKDRPARGRWVEPEGGSRAEAPARTPRPPRGDRPERGGIGSGNERPKRTARPGGAKAGRPARSSDRTDRTDRPSLPPADDRGDRTEKPTVGERVAKAAWPTTERSERRPSTGKPARAAAGDRTERPTRTGDGERSDRPARPSTGERPRGKAAGARPSKFGRDDGGRPPRRPAGSGPARGGPRFPRREDGADERGSAPGRSPRPTDGDEAPRRSVPTRAPRPTDGEEAPRRSAPARSGPKAGGAPRKGAGP
ncbi:MAG: transporter, partial [Gemmatimonadetes bacterium]|nr:transporter [Gemmatimonadota bacterium]